MLKINYSPQRNDNGQQVMAWLDPQLMIDGVTYDLSDIPDGAIVEHPVILKGERTGNDYEVTVTLNHGSNAPHGTRFPEQMVIDTPGDIAVPLYDVEPVVEPEPVVEEVPQS